MRRIVLLLIVVLGMTSVLGCSAPRGNPVVPPPTPPVSEPAVVTIPANGDACLDASTAVLVLLAPEGGGLLADSIPGEVRGDFATVAEAYRRFAAALVEPGVDLADLGLTERVARAEGALAAPEVVDAQQRIDAYLERVCVEPGPGGELPGAGGP